MSYFGGYYGQFEDMKRITCVVCCDLPIHNCLLLSSVALLRNFAVIRTYLTFTATYSDDQP